MELDELKNSWLSLDERLKKQEVLKENILKEMLHTKSDKALSRLIGLEVFGAIILILVLPVIIYGMNLHVGFQAYKTFMYIMLVVSILLFFWQAYKVYRLIQIDFSKPVRLNIEHTNKYNICIKREKIGMTFFVPILALVCSYLYAQLNVNMTLWAFMSCTFVALILFTVWSYKKYDKNIKSILQSLDNLKELEEEKE